MQLSHHKLIVLATTLALFFSSSVTSSAQTSLPPILISEVYPAPATGASEWIELYNFSASESIDLTGWWLSDQVSSPSNLTTLEDLVLPPLTHVVIELPAAKLNNSGDSVILYGETNVQIDMMTYNSSQSEMSWQRYPINPASQTWLLTLPTPGSALDPPSPSPTPSPSQSPTPSPSPSPTQANEQLYNLVSITQVMSCPESGQNEWLKLSFADSVPTGTSLDLSDWYVLDDSENSRSLSGILTPNNSQTVTFSSSFLNNSGETLSVFSPDDQLQQSLTIPACEEKGTAFQFANGVLQTTPPSPEPSPSLNPSPTTSALDQQKANPRTTDTPYQEPTSKISKTLGHQATQSAFTPPNLITPPYSWIQPQPRLPNSLQADQSSLLSVILGGVLIWFPNAIQLVALSQKMQLFKGATVPFKQQHQHESELSELIRAWNAHS